MLWELTVKNTIYYRIPELINDDRSGSNLPSLRRKVIQLELAPAEIFVLLFSI
jgi:hypothetical protein